MLNELVGPRLTHSQLQSQIHSDFHHNFPKLIMIISYLAMKYVYNVIIFMLFFIFQE